MRNKLLLILCLFLVCCMDKSDYPKETKQMLNYLDYNFPHVNYGENGLKIFLIPKLGCGPCVKKAWNIVGDSNSSNLVVITNDTNRLNLDNVLIEKPGAEVKMENLFFMDIYPLLIELNSDAGIESFFHLSPGKEAEFKEKIASHFSDH